ncbi:hypothetical protein FE257_006687 [Aspergillus nanangensis]|uniref:Uncharacterized protein n=1 Tax=Aspergillus nanangensis TaxID=2582783 RepID=A0AAD4GUQ9_ASPNN|nr:hypothetical protein FE257_006687 [Aspergillus nanangensis]
MPKSSKTAESAIEQAYSAYFDRDKPPIRPLAREFGLVRPADYKRLLGRINGRKPRTARKPLNKTLNDSQDEKLRDQLKSFEEQLEEDSELYGEFQAIKQRYGLLKESLFRIGEALPIYQTDIKRFG